MARITRLTLLVLGLSASAVGARAADIIEEPVYVAPEPIAAASNWYIRGDVGYVAKSTTSGDYDHYDQASRGTIDVFHYDEIETDSAVSFGAGVGYRFTDHLRTDVTVDYFETEGKGSSGCSPYVRAGYGLAISGSSDCAYDDSADVSVWTAMANAYVDIATYGRVTPYVGAGLGFAHVEYGEQRNEIVCGSAPVCAGQTNFVGYHDGEASWRFAASLMAGASISLTERLKLDAGYRYTRISEGDAFGFDGQDKAFGATGVQGRDHGFDIHAVRAGLRYEFGGAASHAAPYGEDLPVYAEPTSYSAPVYK